MEIESSANTARSQETPLTAYRRHLAAGELKPDAAQERVVLALEALSSRLNGSKSGRRKGVIRGLITPKSTEDDSLLGIYIHGGVGRGKSMLMDLFFDRTAVEPKRRVHFHEFMLECHGQLHEWRSLGPEERRAAGWKRGEDDPIKPLARHIAAGARLLCFDEFQVTDVADAMILGRLFEALFEEDVAIVATSNLPPGDLYKGGLNRQLFEPFIEMIGEKLGVHEIAGPTDYRLNRMKGLRTYYTPVNGETTEKLRKAFWQLTDRDVGDPATVPSGEIEVQGRKLFVPKCIKGAGVFSFKRLCANPLGAADYLAIAWRFHTVFVVAIPQLSPDKRNEAKRFVTLIDTLYDNNVKLFCSAAAAPEELYPKGDGSFEFQRTVSRLNEMQSEAYLKRGHAV